MSQLTKRAERIKQRRVERKQPQAKNRGGGNRGGRNRGGNNRGGNNPRGNNSGGNNPPVNEGRSYLEEQRQASMQFIQSQINRLSENQTRDIAHWNQERDNLNRRITSDIARGQERIDSLTREQADNAAYYSPMSNAEALRAAQMPDILQELTNLTTEMIVHSAQAQNLALCVAGQPIELIPFLEGVRPPELTEVHTTQDADRLNDDEINAYCVGYRLTEHHGIPARRVALKKFLRLYVQGGFQSPRL